MFADLIARARDDDNVIGVVPSGSRGRGLHVNEHSDWDAFVVVHERRGDYPSRHGGPLDLNEVTLASLSNPPEWARPALLWIEPALDKTGEVAAALRAATSVDPAAAAEPLDGYINMLYRSAKNARAGLALATLLDAAESIPWWLQFVFTVHGRVRPYNKWLEWELREHPLPVDVDLDRLRRIASSGDLAAQRSLFRDTEALARAAELGAVVDDWEPSVAFLRGEAAG